MGDAALRGRPELCGFGNALLASAGGFADLRDHWGREAVEMLAERPGIVRGDGGRFRPRDRVTRQELAATIVRALGLEGAARERAGAGAGAGAGADLALADAGEVAGWARGYVAVAAEKGLVAGMGGNVFGPARAATRAQAAVLVLCAMERRGLLEKPLTCPRLTHMM